MRRFLQWSFGCRHTNTSFPQTVPQTVPSARGHGTVASSRGHPTVRARGAKVTYVTCLNCGQEFNYCWRTMQRLSSAPTWIEEPWIKEPMTMTGNRSSREQREIEELRKLWMT